MKGKFTQTRNRYPSEKVKTPLELVNTDLAGPVNNDSIDGFKYMQSFTDVYMGAVLVYFLKAKNDAVQATEKYLADVAPYLSTVTYLSFWHFAIQEAAYTRNRCFNKHTGTTPYTALGLSPTKIFFG